MQFCQNILRETVELLLNEKLPYEDSIIIGDNASGKSEALKQYMRKSQEVVYFIDAVNRKFDIEKIKPLNDTLKYSRKIFEKRLLNENFNLQDTWSYYGTASECIELIYLDYEETLQKLFKKFTGTGFSVYFKEAKEIRYDAGDVGKMSNGYQAIVRILLELLYFQDTRPAEINEKPVVVIDEIDEYLSPKNAGEFYLFIKDEFPEIKFIVATHSVDIVACASNCNILILRNSGLEILDAGDFKDIDDAMAVFKDVFGRKESTDISSYEEILRKLLNNRIAGVWGENERKCYEEIPESKLTKIQKVLYRQIGEW